MWRMGKDARFAGKDRFDLRWATIGSFFMAGLSSIRLICTGLHIA